MSLPLTIKTIPLADLMAMDLPPIAPEPKTRPTWPKLVEVEPRLADVERLAVELHPRAALNDWSAWARIKKAMSHLAGWEADQFELRTSAAYDAAYDHLLNVWEAAQR